MAEKVDVLICGSGSAGLCAATWLARYGVRCKVLEKMDGPLKVGQADGVQCRTVEIFAAFGKSEELMRESYHVKEVAFWTAKDQDGIVRSGTTPDTPVGVSHMPHVILNQARINGLMLDLMREYNDQHVDYGWQVLDVKVDSAISRSPYAHPVTVRATKDGKEQIFQAKYVFGSDGAHSQVRRSLGFKMIGDSTNKVWGVMDTWPATEFPDIRKKCAIRSREGNILIIPREGGSMVRFYIELGEDADPKKVTREDLYESAKRIFKPYKIEFPDTYWWSAYSIGQRKADFFHKDYRAFLAGDACHTHSPKAGQGMNVSLQDGFNFGWKVASVLKGIATPKLLETYVLERQKVAQDLIDFDRYWTKLWSGRDQGQKDKTGVDFSEAFKEAGDFMAGVMAHYAPSPITLENESPELAKTLTPGMRFPSTKVCRMSDANPLQLTEAIPADTRWTVLVFGGSLTDSASANKVKSIAEYMIHSTGPVSRYTPQGADVDSFINTLLILSGKRADIEYQDLHSYYWPAKGKWQLRDMNKVFFDDEVYEGYGVERPDTYKFYQIDVQQGAIVILRPDGYVSAILALDDYETIGSFFDHFAIPTSTSNGNSTKEATSNGTKANGAAVEETTTNGVH